MHGIGKGAGYYPESAGIDIAVLLHKSIGNALDVLLRLCSSNGWFQTPDEMNTELANPVLK